MHFNKSRIAQRASLTILALLSSLAFASAELFMSPNPNGHPKWVEAIANAKQSVHLAIFNMTDPAVTGELKTAVQRGVDVKVIFDAKSAARPKQVGIINDLRDNGVNVMLSSPKFSIMHQKSMIVDGATAFVTSMNLTTHAESTRDFGIITTKESTANEMEAVFAADWQNSQDHTNVTPELTSDELVWSPVNSRARLLSLIESARSTLVLEVENLSHEEIISALATAQSTGVDVKVITPLCDFNDNPFFNFPALRKLQSFGVSAKVMGIPLSPELPYIHAKMIAVDGRASYVGSINFSFNSIEKAREVGVILENEGIATQLQDEFAKDWSAAQELPEDTSIINCPDFK